MANAVILPFPVERRLQSSASAPFHLSIEWARAADAALTNYASWLWIDETGRPDIPGWIGDAWVEWVKGHCDAKDRIRPRDVDWPRLWARFVHRWLSRQPEWRIAVERAMCGIEGIA